jgi:phosphoribosyl-AMP cyclohydrolase
VTQDPLEPLDWNKGGGMLPAIVQDAASGAVLMLGYMNPAALAATPRERPGHLLEPQQGASVGPRARLRATFSS